MARKKDIDWNLPEQLLSWDQGQRRRPDGHSRRAQEVEQGDGGHTS